MRGQSSQDAEQITRNKYFIEDQKEFVTLEGEELNVTNRQLSRLRSIKKTYPKKEMFLLGCHSNGDVSFTILAEIENGKLQRPRAGKISLHGKIQWI